MLVCVFLEHTSEWWT